MADLDEPFLRAEGEGTSRSREWQVSGETVLTQEEVSLLPGERASPLLDDLDSFSLIEPPPLDWRSDSSSEGCAVADEGGSPPPDVDAAQEALGELGLPPSPRCCASELSCTADCQAGPIGSEQLVEEEEEDEEEEGGSGECRQEDEDHTRIQVLLARLQTLDTEASFPESTGTCADLPRPLVSSPEPRETVGHAIPPGPLNPGMGATWNERGAGLLFSEVNQRDLLSLLDCEGGAGPAARTDDGECTDRDSEVSVTYSEEKGECLWDHLGHRPEASREDALSPLDEVPEPVWLKTPGRAPPEEELTPSDSSDNSQSYPAYKDVPGPCDPEDLLDGVIFGAKYLGSTQMMSDKNPSTSARMTQAQEAVDRIKAPEGESQPMTEVDLFISTQRIKVLSAGNQEAMMDHSLQLISYIADIGNIVVLMARRKSAPRRETGEGAGNSSGHKKKCCMICHVFCSEDAHLIAQAIGQAFGVAYQQFLQANGIKPSELRPSEYSDYLGTQELYNGDLVHFSRSENIREVVITKERGEILGLAVVESGWGSILPTAVVANLLHGGPAERSGELSIGDRIMSVNGTSLVGLPIATCHSIIRDLKNQVEVKLSIVHCPPVTMAIIKRPDPKYQLGFSVEDGIICSLMRGGIAERGGIRVGHRIIEINGQSVVATPHEKIIHILAHAVGEIHLKTMPASTYRLLTGQEQPVFL
uniref:Amyloid-beta A4 precursor protein-binding family A member 3 n=1 Tax=Lepisosteus oculatus TaxID=7918 RepID=W5M3N9_LEPOC|nr:PREDICTED: amyloid beta A4 precursor protein-binding family A member 3-like [Lepisosteus oculatus]